MDRLQIGAIALAVALLAASFMFGSSAPPPEPERGPAPLAERAPMPAAGSPTPVAPAPALRDDARTTVITQSQTRVLDNDALRVVVSNIGGRLESVQLKHYRDRVGSEPAAARGSPRDPAPSGSGPRPLRGGRVARNHNRI